jgi:serine/threonine protein phosphatase PrpC
VIEAILAERTGAVEGAARALIEQANAAGGLDNASAVVVRVLAMRRDEGA